MHPDRESEVKYFIRDTLSGEALSSFYCEMAKGDIRSLRTGLASIEKLVEIVKQNWFQLAPVQRLAIVAAHSKIRQDLRNASVHRSRPRTWFSLEFHSSERDAANMAFILALADLSRAIERVQEREEQMWIETMHLRGLPEAAARRARNRANIADGHGVKLTSEDLRFHIR